MANSSYLSCGRERHTYPSFQEPNFDSELQTVAMGVEVTPLLWLSLFRPEDILIERLAAPHPPGEPEQVYEEPAPVVHRSLLEDRWAEAYDRLALLLPQHEALAEYGQALLDVIATIDHGYPYLTIEMQEIAGLKGPQYYDRVRGILAWFGGADEPEFTQRLEQDIQSRNLPPLGFFRDPDTDPTDDDWETLEILLGGALYRDVPWSEV